MVIEKEKDRSALKIASYIALATMVVLLIDAIVFYKERLFADTSYIAFVVTNSKHLAIQEHRYGSFITQLVPYTGTHLHLAIKTILIAYSISFNVFYCIVASLLVYRYKQYGLAILMALFYTLFVTGSFFWPVNEINQAVAWMFLFYGYLLYLGERKTNFLLLLIPFIVLAFLTLFTHFVVIIPFTFLWVYFWLRKTNWPFSSKQSIILSLVLVCMVVSKFLFVGSNSYDDISLYHVTHFSIQDIIDGLTTPVIYLFLQRCLTLYWPAIIVLICGLGNLAKQRRWRLFRWTLLSLFGYFIIQGLAFGDHGESMLLLHIESEWMCIGIIVATPFVFEFLPTIRPQVGMALLSCIFIVRLLYIGTAAEKFIARTQFQEQILTQMRKERITKAGFYINPDIQQKYMLEWTAGFESLFSSAMRKEDPLSFFFFISRDNSNAINMIQTRKGYWDAYGIMSPVDINWEYYKIDTAQPYKLMELNDLLKPNK